MGIFMLGVGEEFGSNRESCLVPECLETPHLHGDQCFQLR